MVNTTPTTGRPIQVWPLREAEERELGAKPVDETDAAVLAELLRLERERSANLQTALESNRRIGLAVGLVMAEYHLGPEAAFDVLRRSSQATNRKLRELAEDVIAKATPAADVASDDAQ